MTAMTSLRHFQPVRYVHKIVEQAANSWWVYRQPIGHNGSLTAMSRVVFFGRSKADVEGWINSQSDEAVFVLSDN